jgi:hypothetical protein
MIVAGLDVVARTLELTDLTKSEGVGRLPVRSMIASR